MATQATIARAPRTSRANTVTEQASAANTAFVSIAPNAHAEGTARAAVILNIATYLGKAPIGYDYGAKEHKGACLTFHKRVTNAKIEWLAGRAAARMPAGEFKAEHKDTLAKIDYARELITLYAAPSTGKGKKLAKGQKGRRTEAQHKVIRAAEQAWSVLLAELSLNNAKTQSETDKKKRSTRAKATRGNAPTITLPGGTKVALPSGSELVKAPKPETAATACDYVFGQSRTIADYARKHAKLLPADFGTAVLAFQRAIGAAMAAYRASADASK